MHATTIAVDLAKSVFQVSVANQADRIVERKRLTRSQFHRYIAQQSPSLIVMEACATSHYWSQVAQQYGHTPKLLHPYYVRPYVRRNKTDAADADALVRASRDPELLPIPVKQPEQQALQGLHRIRQQLIQSRTSRINLARALLAEFGISLKRGAGGISARLQEQAEQLPISLQASFSEVVIDINDLKTRITLIDNRLEAITANSEIAQRLLSIPGVGVITATALIASVPHIRMFKKARQFASWLGVTPRENSSGNTRRLGRISKQGNEYLRTLLVHGARSVMLQAHRRDNARQPLTSMQRWIISLESVKKRNVVTVAVANKLARTIWATWVFEKDYTP
ncbi:MAG: IS110 family transposase [Gammaproteobacteria bacterium]|jgi:transposase|nr:IS110 family transposase [Gammaproteobacteria bacterium]